MYYLLTILVILSILLVIFRREDPNIEHFYTLFLPFYYPDTIKKFQTYSQNYSSPPITQYNINFIISNEQLKYTYFHLFLKSLIAYNYPIIHVELNAKNNNDRAILPIVNSQKDTLGIIPAPILANQFINGNYENIELLTSINDQYIFIIAPIDKNIDTMIDLDGKTIGVGLQGQLWEQCAKDVFNNIKINYNPYYASLRIMLQKLYNNEIDAILLTDSYPSKILNFIFYNFYNIQLISLDKIHNMDIFYTKTYVDLNQMTAGYLPRPTYREKHVDFLKATLFNNKNRLTLKYLFYTSNFMTLKFTNYLVCNKDLDPKLGYIITKHIFNNKLLLKKSDNAYITLPIKFNEGAKKYYLDYGLMTYNSDINCIKMYGKQKCTKKTLKNNLLNFDPYYNLL